MKRVAVLDDYQRVALELGPWATLDGRVQIEVIHDPLPDPAGVVAALADFEIVVVNRERTPLPAEVIGALPKLELIVTSGMQNAAIDMEFARECGILVSGTTTLAHPTVELTWALILGFARHIAAEGRVMRDGGWQTSVGIDLRGKTLGVIGLGRIGAEVARIGAAFRMDVAGWSPSLSAERAASVGARLVAFDELIAQSDVVTLHVPLNAATRHMLDASAFRAMKPDALLVNTARGPIVDEAALVAALSQREIGGAALDVYDREPLPVDHPLRRLDNVMLTPHLGYVTEQNYRTMFAQAVEDIAAWLDGAPIRLIGQR